MAIMKLLELLRHPFQRLRVLNAGKRGAAEVNHLPFLRGTVDSLPAELSALLLTSDRQGVMNVWDGTHNLLGEAS